MGKTSTQINAQTGLTFDAGGLIAVERGNRRLIALLQEALKQGCSIRVPAGVIGQVWRNGSRQARLARFLSSKEVQIVQLDAQLSRWCGELCGHRNTADVIDASVILVAKARGDVIVTSDEHDMRQLDSQCVIVKV